MDKRQYFIEALQAEAFIYKEWAISVFTMVHPESSKTEFVFDYQIVIDPEKPTARFFRDPNNAEGLTQIDGVFENVPILLIKDKITLQPNELKNVTSVTETIYGNCLINAVLLIWPFGNRFEFITGRIDAGNIDKMISKHLVDDPPDGDRSGLKPTDVTVSQLLKYNEAVAGIAGLAAVNIPAASPKSITVDPAIIKRRDELLEKAGDTVNDPAVLAVIEAELIGMDKANFVDDPAAGFLHVSASKTFNISRKKMYIMHGIENGLSGATKPTFIKNSLKEGWDLTKLPAMADATRAASFDRGNQTALGGESVKFFYRVFQNTKIAEQDCKAKRGVKRSIRKEDQKEYIGLYYIEQGIAKEITEEIISQLIGKTLEIRTPMLCKTEKPSFCAVCVGKSLALSPNGLHIAASDVGSIFMLTFMKSMHGRVLSTARYRPQLALT